MGILYDDVVLIRQAEKEGDPAVITVNCPDKTGLGCDLCRIILFFGLNIVRGGNNKKVSFFFFLGYNVPFFTIFQLKICFLCYSILNLASFGVFHAFA